MEILKNKETAETIRDGFLLDLYDHKEESDFDMQPVIDAVNDFDYESFIGYKTINDLVAAYQNVISEKVLEIGIDIAWLKKFNMKRSKKDGVYKK